MVAGVAIGWVCVPPVLTPPGNVWQLGDTLALVVILTGAGAAGWYGVRHGVAALGAVGGASFRVLLPDSRDMIGIGMGTETLESYLVQYFAFVVATAFASVMFAIDTLRLLAGSGQLPQTDSPKTHHILLRSLNTMRIGDSRWFE